MLEIITKTLDTAKENGVDLFVAEELIRKDYDKDAFDKAVACLKKYYEYITKARVEGKPELIAEIVKLYEEGNIKEADKIAGLW